MIFGTKRSVTGTNPEIGDVNLDAAARGSNLDGYSESWTTPRIAQLLPAMERFIPEFILARGAM
jgi:hypothetical protein